MAPVDQQKIKLKSSDNEEFLIEREAAVMSDTVKAMIDDDVDLNEGIPLPNVSGKILAKVIEYCLYHVKAKQPGSDKAQSEDTIKAWDQEFVKVEQSVLFDLILAANYLNIKELLDLTCQTVADMIRGKTPEEIRRQFNIKNDFSSDEEEEVRKENAWAFE